MIGRSSDARRRRLRVAGLAAAPALLLAIAIGGSALRGPGGADALVPGSGTTPDRSSPSAQGVTLTIALRAGEPQPAQAAFTQACTLVADGTPRDDAIAALRAAGVTDDVSVQLVDAYRSVQQRGLPLSCGTSP